MKVAIFYNYLDNIGGAEIVTLTLARELNADIYTTNISKDKIEKMGFKDVLDKIYSIGTVPLNAPARQQITQYKFRKYKIKKKYDFYIISGEWALSSAIKNKPNLWYIHSPQRELYDLRKEIRENQLPLWKKPIFDIWVKYNRILNNKYIKHVNNFICNSENVKNRVLKYLKKQALVIYPPIYINKLKYNKNKNYWLSVNRLKSHKRIEIQIDAFSKLDDKNFIIVGSYEKGSKDFEEYRKNIEKKCPMNVKIINWVTNDKRIELYSNCKGFITTAKDEDFGITPVEAMASGKAVIAPNEGGYKETIINKKTGILIDNINKDKLANSIIKLEKEIDKNPLKFKNACQKQARKFDTSIFINKIKKEIDKTIIRYNEKKYFKDKNKRR